MAEMHDAEQQAQTPEKDVQVPTRVAAVLRMVTDGVRGMARFWSGADLSPEERRVAAMEIARRDAMHPQ